jgi:hypothetical protein
VLSMETQLQMIMVPAAPKGRSERSRESAQGRSIIRPARHHEPYFAEKGLHECDPNA